MIPADNPGGRMKMNPKGPQTRLILLGLLAVLSLPAGGCRLLPIQPAQVDPIRYYTLSSAEPAGPPPAESSAPRLMILRVEVPAYLQNKPLVTRLGPNEVKVIDDARWAEPLDLGIARALNVRLAALTGVPGMESREMAHDYDVVVRVRHCEGEVEDGKGMVRFAASIDLIRPGAGREVAAHREFAATEAAWDGHDYAELARLLSHAVADLGDAVVAAVPK